MLRCVPALMLLVLMLGGASLAVAAQDPPDAETRLLDAELTELIEVDVDAAIVVYRSLLEDSALAPVLRARTLFALARALRKRGELGAAKETYEELIARHPEPASLVEAARKYRAEIEGGTASLPEFDWVSQVEQSPEIQAQIFDWGMSLVSRDTEVSDPARAKLAALGVAVIPVLEPMLGNTRNSDHRKGLARILVQLGRVEHLPILIGEGGSSDLTGLLRLLRGLDEGARERAIEVLAEIPVDDNPILIAQLASCRLVLGDYSQLAEDLDRSTQVLVSRYPWGYLDPLWEDPAYSARVTEACLAFAESRPGAYLGWLTNRTNFGVAAIETLIGPLASEPLPEDWGVPEEVVHLLIREQRLDLIERLLSGPNAGSAIRSTYNQGRPNLPNWAFFSEPLDTKTRARILRQTGHYAFLIELALSENEAIPELEEFLMQMREDDLVENSFAFRELQFVFRPSDWVAYVTNQGIYSSDDVPERFLLPKSYSPEIVAAMARTIAAATDAWARSFAIEIVVRAHIAGEPSAREHLEGVLLSGAGDPEVEPLEVIQAAAGLWLGSPSATERERRSSQILAAFGDITEEQFRRSDLHRLARSQRRRSSGDQRVWVGTWFMDGRMFRRTTRASSRVVRGRPQVSSAGGEERRVATAVHAMHQYWRHVLPDPADGTALILDHLLEPPLDAPTLTLWLDLVAGTQNERTAALYRASGGIEDISDLRWLALRTGLDRAAETPSGVLVRLLLDRELPLDLRGRALTTLGSRAAEDPEAREILETFDWRAFLVGEDPLAASVQSSGWRKHKELRDALELVRPHVRDARQAEVRRWAWSQSGPKFSVAELSAALEDEDSTVRGLAEGIVQTLEHVAWLSLLHRCTGSGSIDHRVAVIERLAELADPSSQPVLTALLDDSRLQVRNAALTALQEIEATLAEREKFRRKFGTPETESQQDRTDEGSTDEGSGG